MWFILSTTSHIHINKPKSMHKNTNYLRTLKRKLKINKIINEGDKGVVKHLRNINVYDMTLQFHQSFSLISNIYFLSKNHPTHHD